MATNKKKIVETIIGVSVAIVVAFLIRQLYKSPSYEKEMMNAAGELNKNLPMMLDSETRLDNAMALPENIFQYNYTLVNMIVDTIDVADLQNYLEPRILNDVRTNPDLKPFRDHGTTMAYNYKDKNGNFMLKIAITRDQYYK